MVYLPGCFSLHSKMHDVKPHIHGKQKLTKKKEVEIVKLSLTEKRELTNGFSTTLEIE